MQRLLLLRGHHRTLAYKAPAGSQGGKFFTLKEAADHLASPDSAPSAAKEAATPLPPVLAEGVRFVFDSGFFNTLNARAINRAILSDEDIEHPDAELHQKADPNPVYPEPHKMFFTLAHYRPKELFRSKNELHFMNGFFISRFMNQIGKIMPRTKTGFSAKNQRKLAKNIRKARMLGTLPVVGKYLPTLEANFPNQDVLNPVGPIFAYQPRERDTRRYKTQSEKEDKVDLMLDPVIRFPSVKPVIRFKQSKEHIARENLRAAHVDFAGFGEVDELQTEDELFEYCKELGFNKDTPEGLSLVDLKFEAAYRKLAEMSFTELVSFLRNRGGEVEDLETKEEALMKIYLYLNCFKETVIGRPGVFLKALTVQMPAPPAADQHTPTWDENKTIREQIKLSAKDAKDE